MEPHPVPQNILDVEFKLFGAFTLKQFGKILAGCIVGIGIFLININPLIKIPLVIISVFTGILLAIIPNFGVWLNGFIKALFVSPRYVWEKKTQTPEILSSNIAVADPEKDRNVTSALNKKKLDINELPLDKMFGTQARDSQVIHEDKFESPDGENLNDIYSDVFGVTTTVAKRPAAVTAAPIQEKAAQLVEEKPKMAMATQQPQETQEVKMVGNPKYTTVEEYQAEINRLKYELSILAKDNNYKEKEEEIMSKINDLYTEIKLINGGKFTNKTKDPTAKVGVMQSGLDGQVIFGIVVTTSDIPLANASIRFVNDSQKKIYNTTSGRDGKFSTIKPLPPGNYAVFIEFPGKQFHAYNIDVSNKTLPGYKLKEK
ncbi:MAG: carboxypeptidase regulatory-like domain-containing protein [Candidatus Dojkabacteria bacterium]